MVIGDAVELAIRKIGQLISNPTNIIPKGCLRRQQETMIWRKQFLYVLYKLQFQNAHFLFSGVMSSFKYTYTRIITMATHFVNDGYGIGSILL